MAPKYPKALAPLLAQGSDAMPELKLGKYRHFRNRKSYQVIDVAMHTETREKMVIYKALYDCLELAADFGPNPYFVRPYNMFIENVEHEGKTVPRFEYLGE